MGDPAQAAFVRWWVLYREGANIFVQNQLLFLEELGAKFDPGSAETFVQERVRFEDGQAISEWTTTAEALETFASR